MVARCFEEDRSAVPLRDGQTAQNHQRQSRSNNEYDYFTYQALPKKIIPKS